MDRAYMRSMGKEEVDLASNDHQAQGNPPGDSLDMSQAR